MNTTEGKYVFYESDRLRIKNREGVPTDTLRYIEVLEQIANDAYNLWIQLGQPREQECANDLYDALAIVDFMHDEEDSNRV